MAFDLADEQSETWLPYGIYCLLFSPTTSTAPNKNPPTCAHQATPPCWPPTPSDANPLKICRKNQYPSIRNAGMRTVKNRNKAGISVATRAAGNSTINAPITPEIAPLAPTVGTFDPQLKMVCTTAAPTPLIK